MFEPVSRRLVNAFKTTGHMLDAAGKSLECNAYVEKRTLICGAIFGCVLAVSLQLSHFLSILFLIYSSTQFEKCCILQRAPCFEERIVRGSLCNCGGQS
jgi:hypothetical protein